VYVRNGYSLTLPTLVEETFGWTKLEEVIQTVQSYGDSLSDTSEETAYSIPSLGEDGCLLGCSAV
jgi:hypothetical protein